MDETSICGLLRNFFPQQPVHNAVKKHEIARRILGRQIEETTKKTMKKLSVIHMIGMIALFLIVTPIIYLLLQVFSGSEQVLKSSLLRIYIQNTLIMVLTVGSGTALLGVSLAWIVSFYEFPFRKCIRVLLALPLAIPPYIAAYAYADFTYSGGLLPRLLAAFGMKRHFDIMNFEGVIWIYLITLYPYVYLMCLSFYKNSSASLIDNARVLGAGPYKLFFKVGLPMARLPMVAGVTLALMELVSDFGVVDYYGVQAFSTAIYKTWRSYGDFPGAIRLSAVLLLIILAIVIAEAAMRRRLRYFTGSKSNLAKPIATTGRARIPLYIGLGTVILACFLIPVAQLLYDASFVYSEVLRDGMAEIIFDTFRYSGVSALLCVGLSFIIANLTKTGSGRFTAFLSRLATMGYSVPGVIIGLAVIFTFIDIDKFLVPLYRQIGIQDKVLVLSTSTFLLVFAYIVRFLAVSYNNIYSSYRKINPNLFLASHTLGKNGVQTFFRVDLPLMMPALTTAFLLVFLEIIKELPITLMLKPYHIETLTGRVNMYVHNEQYAEAAVPSLIIIALGIVAVSVTMRSKEDRHAGR